MTRSRRAAAVAEWFGLSDDPPAHRHGRPAMPGVPLPAAGEVLLICGASGAGKSTLLRRLARKLPVASRVDVQGLVLPARGSVIDCFPSLGVEQALLALSRVGLAEARHYLLRPGQLSAGQQWRLRLALAFESARTAGKDACFVCDEFAALLDRITARIVARLLRKQVSAQRLRAIVATSHDDLVEALSPDSQVVCDFGALEIKNHRGKHETVGRSALAPGPFVPRGTTPDRPRDRRGLQELVALPLQGR